MFGNDEKIRELRILAEPLVAWLRENSLPDTKIEITQTNAILLEQPLTLYGFNEADLTDYFHEECGKCCNQSKFPTLKLSFHE